MGELDEYQYNNEEEAEMAQLHSIHIHMNALEEHRRRMAKQAENPSLEECEECGEPIPEQRRLLIPGVTMCVDCKERQEKRT